MPSYVLQYLKRTSNTVAAVFYTPRWRQKHHCKQWKSNPREGLAIFLTSGTFDNTWNIDLDPRINHMRPFRSPVFSYYHLKPLSFPCSCVSGCLYPLFIIVRLNIQQLSHVWRCKTGVSTRGYLELLQILRRMILRRTGKFFQLLI